MGQKVHIVGGLTHLVNRLLTDDLYEIPNRIGENKKAKDLGQFPIQSAQNLTACG